MQKRPNRNDFIWNKDSSPIPPKMRYASVVYEKYILIIWGYPFHNIGEVFVFDIEKETWKRIKPRGQVSNRKGHTACLNGNEIIIFGGQPIQSGNETGILSIKDRDPYLLEWKIIKPKVEGHFNRWKHSAHIKYPENKMYVFGGMQDVLSCSNEVWCLNLRTYVWEQCFPLGLLPSKRSSHNSILINENMYIFGGIVKETHSKLDDFWVLNLKTMRWDNLQNPHKFCSIKSGARFEYMNGKLLLLGGSQNKKETNDLFTYDIENETWDTIPTDLPLPSEKKLNLLTVYDNKFYIWGGVLGENSSELYKMWAKQDRQQKDTIETFKAINKNKNIGKLFYLESEFSDITFRVENQDIPAHKIILATYCKYFHNMFTSGMIESQSRLIEVPCVKASTFKAFLQFIYCGELTLTEDLAMDLIELSDKYVFYELQKECEIFLSIILNDENLVRIAKKAERTQSDILLGRIKEFITKNITELQERRDLNEFPYYIGCYYNDVLFNIQSNFDEAALTEREKADLIPNFSSKQNNSDMREDLRE